MSQGHASDPPSEAPQEPAEGDEKYLLRSERQIRGVLQSLLARRALVTAHIGNRDQAFPTAVLDIDEAGWLLLDGSPSEAANRAVVSAGHLLCFAQIDRVRVRFRIEGAVLVEHQGHPALRAPLPAELYHLQRREFYRLQTPVTDSPACMMRFELEEGHRRIELGLRVIDISGGGLAVMLSPGMPLLEVHRTYPGCELRLPDTPPIALSLTVCSQLRQALPNGQEGHRVGMRFTDLPRGADEAIQRYILRIERQRNARKSGAL